VHIFRLISSLLFDFNIFMGISVKIPDCDWEYFLEGKVKSCFLVLQCRKMKSPSVKISDITREIFMHTSKQILNTEFTKNFSRDGCVANVHTVWDCVVNVHVVQVFFKENIRYPVWTCRDPIFQILGIRFSLIPETR